ncbi:MAG: alpha/beta hydrolase [archaeon]
MKKENLVLIHSFPTNKTILAGLIKYLEEYFNIYPIDLPGFNTGVPPLEKISVKNYARYVDKKITELKLKNYILGGVSFGFLIANQCKMERECKSILALEPFINIDYLRLNPLVRTFLATVTKIIYKTKLYNFAYRTSIFKWALTKLKIPKNSIGKILETVDARTLFKTAGIILSDKQEIELHRKPYILAVNENDRLIRSKKIIDLFEKVPKLLVVKTSSNHYPKDLSKEYFRKHINKKEISKTLDFLENI